MEGILIIAQWAQVEQGLWINNWVSGKAIGLCGSSRACGRQGERPGVFSGSVLWVRGRSYEGMSNSLRPRQLQPVSLHCLALVLLVSVAGPGLTIWAQAQPSSGSL